MRWLLLLALTGCTPATTHGFRTDGLLPAPGEVDGEAFGAFGGPLGDGTGVGGGGTSLVVGLSDRLAVAPSLGWAGQTWGADVEARWSLLDEDGLAITGLFGAGYVARPRAVGVHGGAVASWKVTGATRLLLGARANPSFSLSDGDDLLWLHTALGATVRPPTGPWSRLRVGVETFWELPLGDTDAAGVGAMLHVSVRGPLPGR